MDHGKDKHTQQLLEKSGILSDFKEFRARLQETAHYNLLDVSAMLLMTHLKSGDTKQRGPSDEDKHLNEVEFAYKYELTQDHIITLKFMAMGLTYDQIAEKLKTISPDGVKKRVRKIFNKLNVHTKLDACNKAKEEGII